MHLKTYLRLLFPFVFAIFSLTALSGCHKSAGRNTVIKDINKIVYVSGTFDSTKAPNDRRAVYWKDGQQFTLPIKLNTTDYRLAGDVWAMTAIGKDIYIGGTNYDHAGYWKNGIFNSLNVGNGLTVRDMVNDGTNVYTTMNTGNGYLCYKNTQLLGKGGPSIAVDGGNVYVLALVNMMPFLQVNNVITTAVSSELAIAETIAVSNGDVYIAGEGYNGTGARLVVKLLKNNKLIYSATDNSGVFSMAISGKDIYMVGSVTQGYPSVALWKNGVQTIIEPNANARAITIDGNDVYLAGAKNATDGTYQACYWKNGVIKILNTHNSVAKGVVIINK